MSLIDIRSWLLTLRRTLKAAPFSEVITETATVCVESGTGSGRGTIAFLANPPATVTRYRDGKVVVRWRVGDELYRQLDPSSELVVR